MLEYLRTCGNHVAEGICSKIILVSLGIAREGNCADFAFDILLEESFLCALYAPFKAHGEEEKLSVNKGFAGMNITLTCKTFLVELFEP